MIVQERRGLYRHLDGSTVAIIASRELCDFLAHKPFQTLRELGFVPDEDVQEEEKPKGSA